MAALPFVLAGLAVTGEVANAFSTSSALDKQEESVKLQASQQQLEFSQKMLNTIAQTKQNIETQATVASANGASLASPSLKAIGLNTFQIGKRDMSTINTESTVAQISAQNEINAINAQKNTLPLATIGKVGLDLGSMGGMFGWFNTLPRPT